MRWHFTIARKFFAVAILNNKIKIIMCRFIFMIFF